MVLGYVNCGAPLSKETVLRQLEESAGIIKRYGVSRIGIFGSVLRGEAGEASDLDVLVEFTQKTFDDLFRVKVDLVLADTQDTIVYQ